MPEPYNYMLNLPDPSQGMMDGIKNGLMLSSVIDQADQQKQAKAQQAQLKADLGKVSQNPTPAALAQLMVKYPSMSEQFKRTYDTLNTEQQKSRLDQATQVYSALQSGKPEIAKQLLTDQASAYRNSGSDNEAKTLEDIGKLVEISPDTAKTTAGLFLAHAMGPDKFTETFTKLQAEQRSSEKAPYELTEAQAKAQKAAVDSKFAESQAALDLQKKGWDITKIQEDIAISKQNSSIAALNAATNREGNELKRRELQQKLDNMKLKRDESVRSKTADIESARSNMDNMLNTADRILKTPMDIVGSAAGPISSKMPTTTQETADFEALVETLGSQSFLAQIPNIKGMGALSNAEGEKLQAALQNFSLKQSPERLIENVKEAQRLILKARENIANRYGVPESIPDTPESDPTAEEIDAFTRQHNPSYRGAARRE